jgi:hypothetical protein
MADTAEVVMADRFEEMVSAEISRATGRALVVRHDEPSPDPLDRFAGLRASFLAHLIAMRERLPQTLILRRASPDVAVSRYTATINSPRQEYSHIA